MPLAVGLGDVDQRVRAGRIRRGAGGSRRRASPAGRRSGSATTQIAAIGARRPSRPPRSSRRSPRSRRTSLPGRRRSRHCSRHGRVPASVRSAAPTGKTRIGRMGATSHAPRRFEKLIVHVCAFAPDAAGLPVASRASLMRAIFVRWSAACKVFAQPLPLARPSTMTGGNARLWLNRLPRPGRDPRFGADALRGSQQATGGRIETGFSRRASRQPWPSPRSRPGGGLQGLPGDRHRRRRRQGLQPDRLEGRPGRRRRSSASRPSCSNPRPRPTTSRTSTRSSPRSAT